MYALMDLINAFSVIILIIYFPYTVIYLCSCVLPSSDLKDAFLKESHYDINYFPLNIKICLKFQFCYSNV